METLDSNELSSGASVPYFGCYAPMEDSSQTVSITIAVIGLVGVLVGGFIAVIGQWLIQHRTEKLERTFVTSNLVAALDQLAIDCARVSFDDGTIDGHPDESGYHHIQVSDPEFALTVDRINLKYLDATTTYKVLVIPHRIKSISLSVSNEFENDDPPDYSYTFETRQFSFAQLGIEIAYLSDEIRRKHGVPSRPDEIWNPVPGLQDKVAAINERRSKRNRPKLLLGT